TQRLTNVEDGLADNIQRLTNVEGGLANVTQRLTNVEDGLADNTQRLMDVEGSVARASQRLSSVTRRLSTVNRTLTGMDNSITDMDNSITDINDSITGLHNELRWGHEAANTRLLNSVIPLGPFRVIPHKPDCDNYHHGDFPKNLSEIDQMDDEQCNSLVKAWDLDLDHLGQLNDVERHNASKRCLARFMGVTI
ncbi:hypothetical protein EWM64_g6939, partial [Hericium alpestre]